MSEKTKVIYEAPPPDGWTAEEWAVFRAGREETMRLRAEAAAEAGVSSWLDDDSPMIGGIHPEHSKD